MGKSPLTLCPSTSKMGVPLSKCVSLSGETDLLKIPLTVVRTSGEQQDGWVCSNDKHWCSAHTGKSEIPDAHAYLDDSGWRVHLHKNSDNDSHYCGWRRLGTFWPTHLTGNQPAIDRWKVRLKNRVETRAAQQGLPIRWVEHVCSHGTPPKYCSGCSAEDRAKATKWLIREETEKAVARARANYHSALMSNPSSPGWERMCSIMSEELEDCERELADLPPAEPAPRSLHYNPLPDPLLGSFQETPLADDEPYDPLPDLVRALALYFPHPEAAKKAPSWHVNTLRHSLEELDKPRQLRAFTDEQFCDPDYEPDSSAERVMLECLRTLNAIV